MEEKLKILLKKSGNPEHLHYSFLEHSVGTIVIRTKMNFNQIFSRILGGSPTGAAAVGLVCIPLKYYKL